MLGDKISMDIINLATMKLIFAKVRAQKCFVIVARDKADLLTVDLVGNLQTQRVRNFADL